MKKMIRIAFAYAVAAMAGGVFYREFTKFQGFTGKTTLSLVHTHLFLLGMVMFLLVSLFVDRFSLAEEKRFRTFIILYNIGVPMTALMLFVRGLVQIRYNGDLPSKALDASISGLAGIGHILTGIGIVLFFLCLLKAVDAETER